MNRLITNLELRITNVGHRLSTIGYQKTSAQTTSPTQSGHKGATLCTKFTETFRFKIPSRPWRITFASLAVKANDQSKRRNHFRPDYCLSKIESISKSVLLTSVFFAPADLADLRRSNFKYFKYFQLLKTLAAL
jgi:hypothetical protein